MPCSRELEKMVEWIRCQNSESEGGQSSPSDSILGGIVAMWIGGFFPLIPFLARRCFQSHRFDFFNPLISDFELLLLEYRRC